MALDSNTTEETLDPASKTRSRPVLLGIVGDSAAGKTTLARGIKSVFGEKRVTVVCTDDYHRYDRQARQTMTITPLDPACNYIGIMEQHLRLLANGEPILKPIYNHSAGTLDAPVLVEPKEIVIVEGLLGYHTKTMRECYDVMIYLDPPEDLRRRWKMDRDTAKRGYESKEVLADLDKREPDSRRFIRPQRDFADMVVRFHPPGPSVDADPTRLNVRFVLRPTLPHPYLIKIAERTHFEEFRPIRLSLARDRGKPVDLLEVDGSVPVEVSERVERTIWETVKFDSTDIDRDRIGTFQVGDKMLRSESLAITQLLMVVQLLGARVAT